jgi:PAS domain S-box-containing protein/putative nucleotidyltransferase with HDIG domain
MGKPLRVMIIEDSENDSQLVLREIQRGGYDVEWERVETRTAMLDALVRRPWDIIICDHSLPEFHAMAALGTLQARGFDLPFIIVSGSISEEAAVKSLKAGAHDFIMKEKLARLIPAIQRELGDAKTRDERKQAEQALLASEVRYRRLFEAAKDGILILNANTGEIVDVNPFLMEIVGYSHAEFLGKQLWELGFFKDIVANKAAFLKLQEERYIRYENLPLETKDGHLIWVEFVSNAYNVNGKQVIQCNIRDITQRRRAEEQLRYQAHLLSNVHDAIIASDENYRITYWNRAAESLYGWRADETIGKVGPDITQTEFPGADTEEIRRHIRETGLWRGEVTQVKKDETRFPCEISSLLLRDDKGKVTGYVSINRDITERKRAADQLKYHARLLRHINDAVFATDDQLRITAWNRAAEKMYGWRSEEVMGRNVPEILNFELTDEQRAVTRELLLKESIASRSERIYRRKDGRTIYVEANTIALTDGHGKMTGFVSVNRDVTERKQAEEQTQFQIQRLKALRAIDIAISSSFDLRLTLDILLDQVIAQLKTDAAAILLFQPITRTLEHAASRGFASIAIRESRVTLGEGYAGKAILERRTIHIPNLMETGSELTRALLLKGEDFIEYYCVPLIVKGEVKGVLEIYHRSALAGDPEWVDFLETLAGQAAIAIENATLFEDLQHSNRELVDAYDATIEGWSHALDLRDKETEGHSLRVTEMSLELAGKFGFTDEQLRSIRWGALLHDIGKMGVSDNILLKPDKLTDEEWESMKQHPVFALEMLSPIAYLKSSLDIPYCHHEKWDGTGYPRGLKGEVIPLAARLFAVVDVWDALRSDRPYRKGWSVEKTLEHIRSLSGTHFDPKVVEYFLEMIERPNG